MNILITGAGRGIGNALAQEFIMRGGMVVGLSRTAPKGSRADRLMMVPCDVRSEISVRKAIKKALSLAGPFDVVVNSAGITVFKEFVKTSAAEFDDILRTNLYGTMLVTNAVLPGMIRRRTGTIVNIVSYAAKTVYTASSAYSASKAGVAAMMNSLREEVRQYNVRVMNVFPGAVETSMWPAGAREKYGKVMMSSQDLARIVCDAVSQPSHLTVEELVVRPAVGDLRI